jgi:hypothetical protein
MAIKRDYDYYCNPLKWMALGSPYLYPLIKAEYPVNRTSCTSVVILSAPVEHYPLRRLSSQTVTIHGG